MRMHKPARLRASWNIVGEIDLGLLLFVFRAPLVIIWIASSLLSVAVVYPILPLAGRNAMNQAWSRALMKICGVRVRVHGQPMMSGASLWVANHVSWIDIFILSSVRCVAFVAKSEIRQWPVIGWLVAKAGTVFLNRRQRQAIKEVSNQMEHRFARGEVLGLFAEGTTSTGFDILPFRSSLFDPAIHASVDVQPVALRFYHRGVRSGRLSFVGEQTLVQNLCILISATQVMVEVEFLPVLPADYCRELGRVKLAEHAHDLIGKAVRQRD